MYLSFLFVLLSIISINNSWLHWSCIFPFSILFISSLVFTISFLLLPLRLGHSFPSSLRCKVRLLRSLLFLFFLNICIYTFKFTSKHYFHCIMLVLVCFIFIFIHLKDFLISLVISSLTLDCLKVGCKISTYLKKFPGFRLFFMSNFIPLWSE